MLNSFIFLDPRDAKSGVSNDIRINAIRCEAYEDLIGASEHKISLCTPCIDSMEESADLEICSLSQTISKYESMLQNGSTIQKQGFPISNQAVPDMQIEELRVQAASCRIDDTKLMEELFSLKETEMLCSELEDSLWSNLIEFTSERNNNILEERALVKSSNAIAQELQSDCLKNEVEELFHLQFNDGSTSINGVVLDSEGDMAGWLEALHCLSYLRSGWDLAPPSQNLFCDLGRTKVSTDEIACFIKVLESTLQSVGPLYGVSRPQRGTSSQSSVLFVGQALSYLIEAQQHSFIQTKKL